MQYVYILRCSNGSPYTGCTSDLRKRFENHKKVKCQALKKLDQFN